MRISLAWRRVAILAVAAAVCSTAARGGAPTPGVVVVAELFTSEGCSSCPPADSLLRELVDRQPIPGIEVIALEEHVDYWDRLGWRDPFSSSLFTRRQTDYGRRAFASEEIYTPQLVVDGASACVGSDRTAVRKALTSAAARAHVTLRLDVGMPAAARVPVAAAVDVPAALERHALADVMIAVAEGGLATAVRGGENGGRTLAHGAVVRSLVAAGTLTAGARAGRAETTIPLASGWNGANLQVIAFVQERDSRRVLGGAAAAVPAR